MLTSTFKSVGIGNPFLMRVAAGWGFGELSDLSRLKNRPQKICHGLLLSHFKVDGDLHFIADHRVWILAAEVEVGPLDRCRGFEATD